MAYEKGDVVLVPFPFRDQVAAKVRPALVVSGAAHNAGGERAFERADHRVRGVAREVTIAAFTAGAKLEHEASFR